MRFAKLFPLDLLVVPVLCTIALCASMSARACNGREFVTMRRKLHCDRKLNLSTVQLNGAAYVGRVLELTGMVGGVAETDNGLTVMLNAPDHSSPILDIPRAEAHVVRSSLTPHVRVLVQVGDGSSGNVVPLKVMAVADENEVSTIDQAEEAKERAIALQEERVRQVRERMSRQSIRSVDGSGPSLASRGGLSRSGVTGDASAQVAVYGPALNERVRPLFVPYFNFIANHNRRLNSGLVGQITYHLLRFAEANDIDPRLVVAMIVAESDFDPASTSNKGAMGLGQLMPDEARELHLNNPYDVEQNLYGSIAYLRQHLDRFADANAPGGSLSFEQIRLALAAYNAGPGAVRKYRGIPPYRETQGYVRRIETLYRQLCGE